jgi:hypothetical protein
MSFLENSFENDSISYKWWKEICMGAWLLFILFEIAMRYNQLYSNRPLCPFSDEGYLEWYWRVRYACLGGFVLILITLIMKLFQMKKNNKKVPLLIAFHIVTMGNCDHLYLDTTLFHFDIHKFSINTVLITTFSPFIIIICCSLLI